MPLRGERIGGSSRGEGLMGGLQIPLGIRAPRTATSTSNPLHRRPRRRPGFNWKIVALIPGILAFGACARVGVDFIFQMFGFEQ